MRRPLRGVAALLLWALPAAADSHGDAVIAGALRFDPLHAGAAASTTVYPDGLWGIRADVLVLAGPVLVEGSLVRGLGATWHHLVLAVHAGAGADTSRPAFVISGGVAVDLGLRLGPLGVAADLTVHVAVTHETIVTGTIGLAALF